MNIKFLIALFTCIFASLIIKAQSHNHSIDSLLNSYHQKGQFDGSILIGKGATITYSKQFGLANRQFNIPITPSTRFPVASITKLYTAILILKLQEEHKLDINSTLNNYIPDLLSQSNSKITIKQLLLHASGLPKEKVAAYEKRYSIKDFVRNNIKDTLLTEPGTHYEYNNVNYILLGAIIEAVTHQNWQQVLVEKIMTPLGLHNTGVLKTDSIINNLAYGYHNYAFGDLPAKPLRNDGFIYMENYASAGAIYTTTEELFKLHIALDEDKIISAASKRLMYTPDTTFGLVDHTDYFVTLGSYRANRSFKGQPKPVDVIERTGNINGFNAIYIQLPASEQAIIIFCNTDAGDLSKIANEVLAILICKP